MLVRFVLVFVFARKMQKKSSHWLFFVFLHFKNGLAIFGKVRSWQCKYQSFDSTAHVSTVTEYKRWITGLIFLFIRFFFWTRSLFLLCNNVVLFSLSLECLRFSFSYTSNQIVRFCCFLLFQKKKNLTICLYLLTCLCVLLINVRLFIYSARLFSL